jgi:Polyketide cyclase / dehydrase and lipid transport
MAKLAFTVEIAAPPERVGVFFVPQRMPYWYGAEMEAQFTVLGGAPDFALGQKVEVSGRLDGREVSLTAVVTEYRFARVLEWKFQDRYGVRGMQRWEIESAAQGCVLHMRDEYELPGFIGRFFDWLLSRHAVAQRDRHDLAGLKRLAVQLRIPARGNP